MGVLTSDEDFGEGGGLAVGVLHHHCVGGCVLNGASEKKREEVPPKTAGSTGNSSPHMWRGTAGIHMKASERGDFRLSFGPTSAKL